ncbi:MAG: hypothetical protein J6333_04170 [Planctomycetes bacterium]|nr:hypothetical protein [Planctomycetota bacterium]
MSSIQVTDRRGGVYECIITFSYGECARLPFNALRKVNARLDQIRSGGLKATAQFNLRNTKEAANFVEILDLFGEDGSFVHGSPADPEDLKKEVPEDEDEDGLGAATVVSARAEAPAVLSLPKNARGEQGGRAAEKKADARPDDEADDLEIEEGVVANEGWKERAEEAVAQSLADHENREETLARVAKVAGDRYPEQQAREYIIKLLWEKFQDEAYVAAFLKRRDWKNVSEDEVRSLIGK